MIVVCVRGKNLPRQKPERVVSDDGDDLEQEQQVVARNRKVVLGGYIERVPRPREDDMELLD